jgi:predicted AlkP superfamily pyrophosphatase or phosphodiesterase
MAQRVCIIDIPGLSGELLREAPADSALGKWLAGKKVAELIPSFPAVTCSVQATLTTGQNPTRHGIVANGLATFRSSQDQALVDASNFAEYRKSVSFWEQSNQLLDCSRFWQDAEGKSRWKTALLFFQNSMPGFSGPPRPAADIVLTPKPDHGPDGKLTSLCWSQPADLVPGLFKQLGPFPLMNYWGPMAGIKSSQWIAQAAAMVWKVHEPALQWVYLPHLDYDLQRFGPGSEKAVQAVKDVAAAMEELVKEVTAGGKLILLSEYSMNAVKMAVQPNRLLAEAGLLVARPSADGELVDYDRSAAFAMVDHQIAHLFVRDASAENRIRAILETEGMASMQPPAAELEHRRAGDFVLSARPDAWFDYRWWSDPAQAPAFAGLVDIHRKPGYDPLELFWDPAARTVGQNPLLVRGSHGLAGDAGVWVCDDSSGKSDALHANEVAGRIAAMLG